MVNVIFQSTTSLSNIAYIFAEEAEIAGCILSEWFVSDVKLDDFFQFIYFKIHFQCRCGYWLHPYMVELSNWLRSGFIFGDIFFLLYCFKLWMQHMKLYQITSLMLKSKRNQLLSKRDKRTHQNMHGGLGWLYKPRNQLQNFHS